MRLLYAINGLGTGGAERSLAELLPYLEPAGIEPTVACLIGGREGVESEIVRGGSDVRFLGGRGILHWTRALRDLIREIRPNVLQTTHFEADVAGRLAARGSGVPVLTTLVNTPYDPVRRLDPSVPGGRLRAARALDSWTARRMTTHFQAITHAVKDAAVARLGIDPQRITVVERGRDPGRLGVAGPQRRAKARLALGISRSHEVLLSVGRQEFQKGQRFLIEATDRLMSERPDLILLVSGRDGAASSDLVAARARARFPDRIRFLGHRADVPELLAAADVFVFPSLYEGLGCSVIEAMALSLPVVASDIPALREVVAATRSGLLVPPGDVPALTAAVRAVLDDPSRASSMGRAGRDIFEERFRLDQMVQRMIELYYAVAERKVPATSRAAS